VGKVRTIPCSIPVLLALAGSLGVGCKSTPRNCVPSRIAPSNEWTDLNASAPHAAQRAAGNDEAPRSILALSGGGMYGAFSVGILNGWSETGSRPTFDVVTGVSTGALIATYAFLGCEYDAELKRLFTTTKDSDIYRRRRLLAPLRSESVATAEPLRHLIENQITPDVLARVAEAHARGRRLYIGTTNLDTRRLIVWDMGAIASRGELELYRALILASASIPGFFPPVPIDVEINGRRYTELHADGGVSAQVFVQRAMLGLHTSDEWRERNCGPTTVWVISAGKLRSDPSCTGTRTLEIGMNALNGMVYTQTRSDIRRIAALAHEAKADFRLTAVPQNFRVEATDQLFDPIVMQKLFDIGYTLGSSGAKGWRGDPPAPDEIDSSPPRSGTQFLAPELVRPARP
jgi:predicted acylesterase/phospholipase RssA